MIRALLKPGYKVSKTEIRFLDSFLRDCKAVRLDNASFHEQEAADGLIEAGLAVPAWLNDPVSGGVISILIPHWAGYRGQIFNSVVLASRDNASELS